MSMYLSLKNQGYKADFPYWVNVLTLCEEWHKTPSEIVDGELNPLSLLWYLRWACKRRAIAKAHRIAAKHGNR